MLVQALEWFKLHIGSEQIEVDERQFVRLGYEEQTPPQPKAMAFNTLAGFADFTKLALADNPSAFVLVDSSRSVGLYGPLNPVYRTREKLGQANPITAIGGSFSYEVRLNQEDFVTHVQAFFVDDEETDKALLLRIAGNLRASDVRTLEDDGISQQVATAKGVTMSEMAVMPNPVSLREYGTFPEIEQPLRKAIVRVRGGGENEYTTIMLKLVPDPLYDSACAARIARYLTNALPGVTVLG
jgi:hypothetical protein